MSTLYLEQPDLEVRADGNVLALYTDGMRTGTVPVKFLERVVIRSHTRLDSDVLTRLAEAGAATVIVSPRIGKRVAIVLGPAHNDAAVRLAQAGAVLDRERCARYARNLVGAKLQRQRRTLDRLLDARPDARKPLFDARNGVMEALGTLVAIDTPEVATIRGLEGAAARAYFQGYAAALPPAAGFTGRNRRPPRDPVNVCLSLAYTLIHADAVRTAHCAGLDPLLGFYHRPAFGRESLACDLIEPLRPVIDLWVWDLWRRRTLREEQYTMVNGACVMHKAARERFYPAWESLAGGMRRWLRQQTSALARGMRAEGVPLLAAGDEDDEP